MQLPVTQETLQSEMKAAVVILNKWISKVDEGIPGVDLPAQPEALEDFMRALCGELLIVSGKCENLSNVLTGEA